MVTDVPGFLDVRISFFEKSDFLRIFCSYIRISQRHSERSEPRISNSPASAASHVHNFAGEARLLPRSGLAKNEAPKAPECLRVCNKTWWLQIFFNVLFRPIYFGRYIGMLPKYRCIGRYGKRSVRPGTRLGKWTRGYQWYPIGSSHQGARYHYMTIRSHPFLSHFIF